MRARTAWMISLALVASLVHGQPASLAVPSQQPLINRTGTGVKPNVMLMLDDSGSMDNQHMPEGLLQFGSVAAFNSPLGALPANFHPNDVAGPWGYVVASVRNTPNWAQRLLRSPEGNSIYYNPEIRYLPRLRADGSRYPDAEITAARIDPDRNLGTIDLSLVLPQRQALWALVVGQEISQQYSALDFEPGLYYRLRKDAKGAFLNPYKASNYDMFSVNEAPTQAKTAGRTDCQGTVCTLAEEQRNFANWFVYHRSRLLLAKAAIGEVVANTDNNLRLGYGRINAPANPVDGISGVAGIESGVRDLDADRRAKVIDWLYALRAGGATPLRQALQSVGTYFQSASDLGPWSDLPGTGPSAPHQVCRRAYQIIVTDGYWNDSVGSNGLASVGNVDGSAGPALSGPGGRQYTYAPTRPYQDGQADTLADYAMKYWVQDLRPDLENRITPSADNPAFWQSLSTFTVGLGLRGSLDPKTSLPGLTSGTVNWTTDRIDDLWHAALNSRGQFFSAQNPEDLKLAIGTALRSTLDRELHDAGVATASASLDANNRRYVPRYKSGAWTGDVEAFALDATGQAGARLWTASAVLPVWGKRNIQVWDAGQRPAAKAVPFLGSKMSADARASLAPANVDALVNYLRGDRSGESSVGGMRVRAGVMGDFINSPPVFAGGSVEPGNALLSGEGGSYQGYLNTLKSTRKGVLWIGGNDGMLHGFQDTQGQSPADDGQEIFAYVPGVLLPRLAALADRSYGLSTLPHRYFVDGILREADVFVPAPGATAPDWRNYLFGTLGAGGQGVFALDITDPTRLTASSVRWEIGPGQAPSLGYQRFAVQSGRLPNGQWVAVFGNGSLSADGSATLLVVDLATAAVQSLSVDNAGGNGLGGVALAKDAQGQINALYAGDLKGQLWKFDYDASAASHFKVSNAGAALFTAPPGQPIVQAPVVLPASKGGHLVVFATGQMLTDDDAKSTGTQAVYAVQDKPDDTLGHPLSIDQLVPRTLSLQAGTGQAATQSWVAVAGEAIDWSQRRGWYANLDLPGYAGLRVVYALQAVGAGYVFIGAVAPGQAVGNCDTSDGKGISLLIPAESAIAQVAPIFDTDGNAVFDSHDDLHVVGYGSAADGVDAVVAGRADAQGMVRVSLQSASGTMNAQLFVPRAAAGVTFHDYRWRRLVNPPL